MRTKSPIAVTAVLLLLLMAPQLRAATYSINFNGPVIDLVGFITTDGSTGTFSPTAFDAIVTDFSFTASGNGAGSYDFAFGSSTWGGGGGFGTNVSIIVSATEIQLSAPTGDPDLAANAFLLANVVTNGAQENLRIVDGTLAYRRPNPPNDVIYDNSVSAPFVLGTANNVPEPASLLLLGLGLLGAAAVARRRAF